MCWCNYTNKILCVYLSLKQFSRNIKKRPCQLMLFAAIFYSYYNRYLRTLFFLFLSLLLYISLYFTNIYLYNNYLINEKVVTMYIKRHEWNKNVADSCQTNVFIKPLTFNTH